MAQRVLIGQRYGEQGAWVSRPGRSVMSTVESDLLLSTTRTNLSPVMSGVIVNPSLPRKAGDDPSPSRSNVGLRVNKNGWVHYEKIYKHNLGYTPIAFFSVGSQFAGEHYPQIYINDTEVRLYHRFESLARTQNTIEYQYEFVCDRFNNFGVCVQGSFKYVNKDFLYFSSAYPASMDYRCNIHYILYRQRAT